MEEYSLVTDAIARMNVNVNVNVNSNAKAKDPKLVKYNRPVYGHHAPLAREENMDSISEYAQVRILKIGGQVEISLPTSDLSHVEVCCIFKEGVIYCVIFTRFSVFFFKGCLGAFYLYFLCDLFVSFLFVVLFVYCVLA